MYKTIDQLTVKRLIYLLRKQNPNAPVWTEGYDCDGAVIGVRLYDKEFSKTDDVLIQRA